MMRRIVCRATPWLICGLLCVAGGVDVRGEVIAPQGTSLSPPRPLRFQTSQYGPQTAPLPGLQGNAFHPPVIQPGRYPNGPAVPHRGHGGAKHDHWNSRPQAYPVPIIVPQIYGYPPPASPATLGNQIEIAPYGFPLRTRSSATYQIVPADPPPTSNPEVEVLPSPTGPEYFELPTPTQ